MTIQNRTINYYDNNTCMEAYLAYDDAHSHARPGVLIAHTWAGRNEFACQQARELATAGYIGFALDLYGQARCGQTPAACTDMMQPFMQNRSLLQNRMQLALEAARQQPEIIPNQIAAIGFCFGGLCVLDLARTGADICGGISVHGLFEPPDNIPTPNIRAKILLLHGHNDPMISATQTTKLQTELTDANADWQMHIYGHTLHAFTNPQANNLSAGTVYNPQAARRAKQSILNFLAEIFS